MMLHDVHRGIHKHKKRRRIGRGPGSGHGKTSGRGHKGQGARNGFSMSPAFQGGQMPLVRRIPKYGFNNRFRKDVAIINLCDLECADVIQSGGEVTPEILKDTGLVKGEYDQLKILGNGELTKKLKVSAHKFSQSAKDAIEKVGGEVIILPGPAPVVRNKMGSRQKAAAEAQ